MKKVGRVRDKFLTKDRLRDIVTYLCRGEKRSRWTRSMIKNWGKFFEDPEGNIDRIYNALMTQSYEFHPFNTFVRYENGKRRNIFASVPEDQIVDTLLDACLKYVFMEKKKIIHPHSYGSIKGKGQHELRELVIKRVHNRKDLYVAVCDTHHYYPTINHKVMAKYIRQHIKDPWLIWLCDATINRMHGEVGMALGLASSNILGHVYHAAIDWTIIVEYGIHDYYRFCDDKLMISSNLNYLHTMVRVLRDLTEENGQSLKPNWRVVHCEEERFEFLGASINSHNARLKTPSRRRIERRFKKEMKKPFNPENKDDRDRVMMSWAGMKGGLRGLDIGNLERYWRRVYKPFFDRLQSVEGWIEIDRAAKKWHNHRARSLAEAWDCRSDENKRLFPLAEGLRPRLPQGEILGDPQEPFPVLESGFWTGERTPAMHLNPLAYAGPVYTEDQNCQ